MAQVNSIEWQALEHHHSEKTNDWFWGVGIVAVGIAVLSIYFGNLLFAIVILLGTFALMLHAHAKPRIIKFKLSRKGVRVGESLYSYADLSSFWVIDEEIHDKIIIKSRKLFMPYLILPYDSTKIDPDTLRDYLLDYMDEEELYEPFSQKIMEYIGF